MSKATVQRSSPEPHSVPAHSASQQSSPPRPGAPDQLPPVPEEPDDDLAELEEPQQQAPAPQQQLQAPQPLPRQFSRTRATSISSDDTKSSHLSNATTVADCTQKARSPRWTWPNSCKSLRRPHWSIEEPPPPPPRQGILRGIDAAVKEGRWKQLDDDYTTVIVGWKLMMSRNMMPTWSTPTLTATLSALSCDESMRREWESWNKFQAVEELTEEEVNNSQPAPRSSALGGSTPARTASLA